MKIHTDLVQGTQEWLDLRKKHFTASEAQALMGCSKYMSRDQLLHMKATGEEPDNSGKQWLFDKGHQAEDGARPLVEDRILEELNPWVITNGKYLASYDGITESLKIAFEHKLFNKQLIEDIKTNGIPDTHYWQLEHQFLVCPDLEQIIFVVSDGTSDNYHEFEYKKNPKRQKSLIDSWDQFEADLKNYTPPEEPEVILANEPKQLPALVYQIKGTLIEANLSEYRERALILVEESKEKDLTDDQAFEDAKLMVKAFEDSEKKIKLVKSQVLAEFTSLDSFNEAIDEVGELIRRARINTSNKIDSEQKKRKKEIIDSAHNELLEFIKGIEETISHGVRLPAFAPDFTSATKNKKTLKSLKESANQHIADYKIKLNEQANLIRTNLKHYDEFADDYKSLFPDLNQLVLKNPDDFSATAELRITKFEQQQRDAKAAEERAAQNQESDNAERSQETVQPSEPDLPVKNYGATRPANPVSERSPEPTESQDKFSDQRHDVDVLEHTANYLRDLVFPEMKTERGKEICINAQNAVKSIADKINKAAKSI